MTAPTDAQGRARCPVDHVDLIDPGTFENGVPLDFFAKARAEAPVYWQDQPGGHGGGFWVVSRYAEVQEVSRTPEVFSSYERGALLHTGEAQDEEEALAATRMLMLNM
ncbi:MAG TPA: hypothetical protein VL281_01735, partial [Mycobacteriales bacterium]|nr:hypothetical protein [Mycobacteriales bacterium]